MVLRDADQLTEEGQAIVAQINQYTGNDGNAEAYFAAALEESIETGRRLSRLLTLRFWGEWQVAIGQREAGIAKLKEAKALASEGRLLIELNKQRAACERLGLDFESL